MCYGVPYQAETRECSACGSFTNVHLHCDSCEAAMCDYCAHGKDDKHFCSKECMQDACEHVSVSCESDYDVDEISGCARYWEVWTCRDCVARIDEDGEIIRRIRRAS